MRREKFIGGIIAFVPISIIAFLVGVGLEVPFPSWYLVIFYIMNAVFAFVSIFTQRLVISLYEANVFEEPANAIDYGFKYIAIFSSGLNYFIQNICNRLPFVLNKLAAAIFFFYLLFNFFALAMIFS